MQANTRKLEKLTKDLRKEEPRHANDDLAGFKGAARALDKCRATLLGCQGDYTYGCPLDQMFFAEAGIDADQFKTLVASGVSDTEVEVWLREHASASSR